MEEDENALQMINSVIKHKCEAKDDYIQLISHFAPAIKRVAYWNKNKDRKITELLTASDKAFLIVCIIDYGPRWIAMHRNIAEKWDDVNACPDRLPVSWNNMQCCTT
jgi:hypothetical protein